MHYDTLIIGAGSSGAVLAARLSEDPARQVLLVEAGPDFPDPATIPEEIRYGHGRENLWTRAFGEETRFGWGYRARTTATAEPMFVPRGKVVGGSSAVNAQIYLRGEREDYDGWAAAGNDQWSFARLLPYFCRIEHDLDFADSYHGQTGLVPVRRFGRAEWLAEHTAFYAACRAAGYPDCPDHNRPDATGVGPLAFNNTDGLRWSTLLTYLAEARRRANLTILADSPVQRILFAGDRASGVTVAHNGDLVTITANEIVVCAGAIGSPHLLLRSGIGPATDLRRLGVPVVCDLPGVGQNLRDHPQVLAVMRTQPQIPVSALAPRLQVGLRYTASGSVLRNDMLIVPSSFATAGGVATQSRPIGFYLVACLYLALGAGALRLRSTDPAVQPIIDFNYLGEAADRARLREAVAIMVALCEDPHFGDVISKRLTPTAGDLASTASLDAWLLRTATTSHHVSSTCKMGPSHDPLAVVDQTGRVHGLTGLRVADASIMPDCVRANTNATCLVIGERIADFIRYDK